jgi:hypothetical protein
MSVVRGRRGEAVETTYLSAIPNISSTESDGRGNVEFGNPSPRGGLYSNTGVELFGRAGSGSTGLGFYDIEDPHAIVDLVERLRERDRA